MKDSKNIIISIVEDEIEFQDWIKEEIQDASNITCAGVFDVAENALAEIPNIKPDIVIMDLGLKKSEMQGIECMLRLKLVMPEVKLLVLSSNDSDELTFEALRVGAGAYIDKSEITKKLIEIVQEFHDGGAPMSPGIARLVIESFQKSQEDLKLIQTLTNRQKEVLDWLSKGFLFKEIADKLGVSEGTIKQHANKIYKKLQVNNRTEAINKYLR